jgi:hypothetical protein
MTLGLGRIFSLSEANELVPVVSELTAGVVEHLEEIRQRHELRPPSGEADLPEPMLKEIEHALQQWSETIQELGAMPKGYFTVDFRSFDPELLYCWTYGEERIGYTHKVWENFMHRRPLAEGKVDAADHLKWIN